MIEKLYLCEINEDSQNCQMQYFTQTLPITPNYIQFYNNLILSLVLFLVFFLNNVTPLYGATYLCDKRDNFSVTILYCTHNILIFLVLKNKGGSLKYY